VLALQSPLEVAVAVGPRAHHLVTRLGDRLTGGDESAQERVFLGLPDVEEGLRHRAAIGGEYRPGQVQLRARRVAAIVVRSAFSLRDGLRVLSLVGE